MKMPSPPDVPSMISGEEKSYLYWIASRIWSGAGHVVEIGPWLGGSTLCLAQGMAESRRAGPYKLHVFDNFIWRAFMAERAPLPIQEGDSFESYFLKNTAAYKDIVVTHRQSLPDDAAPDDAEANAVRDLKPDPARLLTWPSREPVELLFIDGAKSWSGLVYLLKEFSDCFIPGKTLLLCQDYKYWGTYWVALAMETLAEHLELVHNLERNMLSFRVISAMDKALLARLENPSSISARQGAKLLDAAAQRLDRLGDAWGAAILRACKVRFFRHRGRAREAVQAFRKAERQWPWRANDANLELARQWLAKQSGKALGPSMRSRLRRLLKAEPGAS